MDRQRRTGAVGARAEQRAFDYLRNAGLRPVARNFRRRGGEIDLVMFDGDCLAFVEVRFRQSGNFAAPGVTVDRRKQNKLIRTAALFITRHRHLATCTMRFDVVSIVGDDITWIRDAFRPDDSML